MDLLRSFGEAVLNGEAFSRQRGLNGVVEPARGGIRRCQRIQRVSIFTIGQKNGSFGELDRLGRLAD